MNTSWSADRVLELARNFQGVCVLAAGAELDVFNILADTALTAPQIAERLKGDLRAATIVLDALAALGLLIKANGQYRLAPGVAQTLTDRGDSRVLDMVWHQANCLRRWSQLAVCVKTGRPAPRSPSVRGEAADHASFIAAMDNLAAPVAAKVIEPLQSLPCRHLLDVGGASGSWTIAFLRHRPQAQATLFDLPPVMPMAASRLTDAGMINRVRLVAGDFLRDPLPTGADLAWISAIVHQNSRRQNRHLFRSTHEALDPGGRIVIRDVVMDSSRTTPVAGALFAVNMLTATEAGGTFTLAELREDLESVGFTKVEQLHHDEGMHSLVAAVKKP